MNCPKCRGKLKNDDHYHKFRFVECDRCVICGYVVFKSLTEAEVTDE